MRLRPHSKHHEREHENDDDNTNNDNNDNNIRVSRAIVMTQTLSHLVEWVRNS